MTVIIFPPVLISSIDFTDILNIKEVHSKVGNSFLHIEIHKPKLCLFFPGLVESPWLRWEKNHNWQEIHSMNHWSTLCISNWNTGTDYNVESTNEWRQFFESWKEPAIPLVYPLIYGGSY